jgi:hypothetical protein
MLGGYDESCRGTINETIFIMGLLIEYQATKKQGLLLAFLQTQSIYYNHGYDLVGLLGVTYIVFDGRTTCYA